MDYQHSSPSRRSASETPPSEVFVSPMSDSSLTHGNDKSVVPIAGGLEPAPDPNNFPEYVPPNRFQGSTEKVYPYGSPGRADGESICGLQRTTFVLSVLLAAVVVIAAVTGGVVGSLAVKKAY